MTQRNLNLWGGLEPEELERWQAAEDNFTEVMDAYKRNYADELTAAVAGVLLGQMYHTSGALKIRYNLIPVPQTGRVGFTGYAPIILHTMNRAPSVGSLTLAGAAPVVTQQFVITPPTGSLSLTGRVSVLS
jgi:hypothetical protein